MSNKISNFRTVQVDNARQSKRLIVPPTTLNNFGEDPTVRCESGSMATPTQLGSLPTMLTSISNDRISDSQWANHHTIGGQFHPEAAADVTSSPLPSVAHSSSSYYYYH